MNVKLTVAILTILRFGAVSQVYYSLFGTTYVFLDTAIVLFRWDTHTAKLHFPLIYTTSLRHPENVRLLSQVFHARTVP